MTDRPAPRASAAPARSVRVRLLAIALLPMLVVLPLLLGVTMGRWNDKFDQMLFTKVNSDLTVARQYLARILEVTGERVQALGASARFRDTLPLTPQPLMDEGRASLGLDFLYLVDPSGVIIASSPAGAVPPLAYPVVRGALTGQSRTAIDIFDQQTLQRLSPDLGARATLPLVPTAAASPTTRTVEDRGMVVHSATPVTLEDGRRGALVGGLLLNQNLVFIDTINDLVYRDEALLNQSQGTATLFLDDVRISTNVRLFEGARALGTRVSQAVRDRVLTRGQTWRASAFVVNDWYISAYEPILDSRGARVGMLYVGFLEAPFAQAKRLTVVMICVAFLAITLISVPVFLRWAQAIFRPLERVTGTIARVEAGDLGARTGVSEARDEISRVAGHLDGLLDQIQQRDRDLRAMNDELNLRVEARTQDLQRANLALEAATRQLVLSEKLAAIGEITAGVAHEINNPVAVIQGNLEVVRAIMGQHAAEADTEFRLIEAQVQRITAMVGRLLQFARPEEFGDGAEPTDPAAVARDCLPLVQHVLTKGQVLYSVECQSTRMVLMNPSEVQQVLVNLILNAVHAMPDGGHVTLACHDAPDAQGRAGIVFRVTDTGIGMDADTQARIFDPFFTTRREGGTGLGLSICHTLITRQGGSIDVQSAPGKGTTFSVWLPEAR